MSRFQQALIYDPETISDACVNFHSFTFSCMFYCALRVSSSQNPVFKHLEIKTTSSSPYSYGFSVNIVCIDFFVPHPSDSATATPPIPVSRRRAPGTPSLSSSPASATWSGLFLDVDDQSRSRCSPKGRDLEVLEHTLAVVLRIHKENFPPSPSPSPSVYFLNCARNTTAVTLRPLLCTRQAHYGVV